MFAKFLKLTSKKHQETQEIDAQLKTQMKDIDEKISEPIQKILKTSAKLVAAEAVADKDVTAVAASLTALGSKDLSRDNQESAYVLALAKFADLMRDMSNLGAAWGQETTDKLVTPMGNFHRVEVTENVRIHRKAYEKATQDFSQGLSKTDQLHASKKQDILKLYAAEKERVRLKRLYEACVYDLRQQADEVTERINIDLLEELVDATDAQKRCFGLIYSELDEIKSYMDDLQVWCNEERGIFSQHQAERAAARNMLSVEEGILEIKLLIQELDRETIDIIKGVGAQTPGVYQDIEAPLAELSQRFGAASAENTSLQDLNPQSLQTLLASIKNVFPMVGVELIARQKLDKLISLSEALGQLEKAAPPMPQTQQ